MATTDDNMDNIEELKPIDLGKAPSTILSIPPHWHKNHDEYMTVLSGSVEFTLGSNQKITLSSGEPPLHIPRETVHSFTMVKGVKATFKEETDPEGEFKEAFFRDVAREGKMGLDGGVLSSFRAFSDGDTYIALPLGSRVLDQAVTHLWGYIAKAVLPARQ